VSGEDAGQVLRIATELCKAANKTIDEHLPQKLAGIVKTHSGLAVASALIPIPGGDVAAAGANIWTMYIRINKELNLTFAEAALKGVAAGVLTNLAAYQAGMVIGGSLLKFIPGLGTVGGAVVLGATIYSVTLVSSIVYMTALTKLFKVKAAETFSAEDLKTATDEALKDKATLKAAMKEAKASYQPEKPQEAAL
jgi:uncharacterized protein (DUF697 family)